MNISVNDCFQIKTKTFDDVFGEVIWKIVEMKLPNRPDGSEGIRCEIITGTGPSAKPGYQTIDSRKNIEHYFTKGLARIIPPAQIAAITNMKGNKPNGGIYTEIE